MLNKLLEDNRILTMDCDKKLADAASLVNALKMKNVMQNSVKALKNLSKSKSTRFEEAILLKKQQ